MPGALYERDDELARADALLAAARASCGGILGIAGPAGIGKTSLMRAARARARSAGMRVLSGRGEELESGFSFGVARQLFEPLLAVAEHAERDVLLAGAAGRAVKALEAGAPAPAGADPPFAVVHGLYWLTVNSSRASPLLMAVDDLHWADQASLRFLHYLAGRLAGLPVALMLAWRTGAPMAAGVADYVARFEQIAAGGVVSPRPLSGEAVRAMLSAPSGTRPGARFSAACRAVTGGNPFLLQELTQTLQSEGIGAGEENAGRVAGLGPRSVARAVGLRMAKLGPPAGELARAAAILGDGAALRHAAALAGADLPAAAEAADGLAGIGVLEPGTPLRFVHSMVRTAVHDHIPRAVRGLRHAEAARLLASEGADPDVVCAHLLACEPTGSRAVAGQLQAAAARAIARGAPESAVAYLQRALTETPDLALRAVLLHELGMAEKMLFGPAAASHLRESLELTGDPAIRVAAAPGLAELLVLAGRWDAGAAVTHAARREIASYPGELSDSARAAVARLQTWWAGFAAFDPNMVGEFDRHLNELLAIARRPGAEPPTLAAALAGILAWRGEDAGTVRALLRHALAGTWLHARVDSDPLIVVQAVFAAVWLGELERAEALARQLFAVSRSRSSVAALGIAALLRTAVRARRGDLVGAETAMRMVIELAMEHGAAFAIPSALYWGVNALTERAELTDVAALAAGTELDPSLARTASGAMVQEVRGRLALADGDFSTARAELQAAASTYETLHLVSPGTCWRSALALAIAAHDPGRALQLAACDLQQARRAGSLHSAGIALRTRGLLEGGQQGLHDLREAAGVLAKSDSRLEHARALVELGAALRRANQRTAAREPLRHGLDLAYRCGAGRLAQRAADELRATGARPRRSVLTGIAALTPSERRIAELAAGGMSNPEIAQALFVTLNTVEGHLRHVYQKLSVSSRSQLPAALRSAVPATPDGDRRIAGRRDQVAAQR